RVHPRDLFGDAGELVARGALGSQAGHANLEDAPRLEHLVAGESVQRRQEAQWLAAERGRAATDERARAMTRLHHAHGRQRAQPRPHAGAAHPDLLRELPLRWKASSGAEVAPLDELADVTHHQLCRQTFERFLGWERLTCGHTKSTPLREVATRR